MIQLLGIPYDKNSSYLRGPALAPSRIRLMGTDGSANKYSEYGLEIKENKVYHDLGDMTFEKTDPESAFHQIRDKISGILANSGRLICLGGDHSISYPVIDAHADVFKNLNILQFDAHSDLYHNFDDNPYSHASPFARLMETGKIQSLTQVGIRALTDHQLDQARKFDVQIVEMNNFSTEFLNQLKGPLYISVDMDVLDPAHAPGVSHHEPGGISTRELFRLLHQIKVPIAGADIVEYNPTRDLHNMTAMVGYKLFKEMVHLMDQNPLG